MERKHWNMPRAKVDWKKVGFASSEALTMCLNTIEETTDFLEDIWEIPLKKIQIKKWERCCWARVRERLLSFSMYNIAGWIRTGYAEYATIQYLIGVQHRRGKPRKPSPLLTTDKSVVQAIVAHEYAHIVTGVKYERLFPRSHGVEFQMVFADMLDQVFGREFGAVERLLTKKPEQVERVFDQLRYAEQARQDKMDAYMFFVSER